MRRAQASAFANPVLIGAVTVLIVLVAVFLAYNANAGLPFVPTQELKVDMSDGSDLTIGNDVREGGYLVGQISNMRAVKLRDGSTGAQLTLEISEKYFEDSGGFAGGDSAVVVVGVEVYGFGDGSFEAGYCGWGDVAGVPRRGCRCSLMTF